MPIAKEITILKVRQQISQWLETRVNNEFLKNDCGKLLFDLACRYGYDSANKLVVELGLDERLQIPVVCPLNTKRV